MEVKTLFSFSKGAEIMLESGIISDNEDTIVFIKSKNNHTFINFGYVDYCYVYNKHHFSGHNLENLEAVGDVSICGEKSVTISIIKQSLINR